MPTALSSPRLLAGSLMVLAAAYAVATLAVIDASSSWASTYAGASPGSLAADVAAGFGLIAAGGLMWVERRERFEANLAVLAGITWLASDWIGWQGGPPLARSLAAIAAPMTIVLVLHLVVSMGRQRVGSATLRVGIGGAYVAVAGIAGALALVRDPRLDPYCWNNCTDNPLLLSAQPAVASALGTTATVAQLAVAAAIVLVALVRLVVASPTARRMTWPVLLPGTAVGLATAVYAGSLLVAPLEGPQIDRYAALYDTRAWSAAALAAGVAWTALRARQTRAGVARLPTDLAAAPQPGTLAAVLARAVNDPTLQVGYWLMDRARLGDAAGRTIEIPKPADGREFTPIVRDGRPIAVVIHDPDAVTSAQLEGEIGAAALLAVDNERLQAELMAQLAELRASRSRIVEASDRERQTLERNLHDGAQQRLVALSYDLRIAHAEAVQSSDDALVELTSAALAEVQRALDELRVLAHGIYPAVLTESGLGAAVETLADLAPVPLEIIELPHDRFSPAVERTAHAVVAAVVERASINAARGLALRISADGDSLIIEVGGGGDPPLADIGDWVGALGGQVTVEGSLLRVAIPCA